MTRLLFVLLVFSGCTPAPSTALSDSFSNDNSSFGGVRSSGSPGTGVPDVVLEEPDSGLDAFVDSKEEPLPEGEEGTLGEDGGEDSGEESPEDGGEDAGEESPEDGGEDSGEEPSEEGGEGPPVQEWPPVTDPEIVTALDWAEAAFDDGNGLPVSFTYNGVSSSQLLPTWQTTSEWVRLQEDFATWTVTSSDPNTGLVMVIEAMERYDFASVEWVVRFENTGAGDTPILENIQALSASFGPSGEGPYTLHHALGSHAQIDDFSFQQTTVSPDGSFSLSPYEGRSSDGALPFFNVEYPGDSGVVLGIGWTGQWAVSATRASAGPLQVQAGMEHTHLRLYPGESIRTPSITLLFYTGADYYRGQVFFRRLLQAQYVPKSEGVPIPPPIAAAPAIQFEAVTEDNMVGMINQVTAHGLPVDTYWMDAGWFELTDAAQSWVGSVGNFNPDPVRFPNGLGPVADAAHAAGLRYLLWYEPERVMPGTMLFNQHPEWLIAPPNDLPPELVYQFNDGFYLLDLGNDDARSWLLQTIVASIGQIGVDIYRHDMNLYPLQYWRSQDASDRQGMTEIRYITGLYAYFDGLKEAYPDLLIDNCASGGRRIDMETLRRSLVLTRSDYLWDPSGQQNHMFGLSKWLPVTGIGAASLDTYSVRSGYGTHFVLAQNYNGLTDEQWAQAQAHLTEVQALQSFFSGDFVTLTGTSNDDSACVAYAHVAPDASEALLQVFRRPGCPNGTMTVALVGLAGAATYLVQDQDGGAPFTSTGAALMTAGIPVTFSAQPQAKVYTVSIQ